MCFALNAFVNAETTAVTTTTRGLGGSPIIGHKILIEISVVQNNYLAGETTFPFIVIPVSAPPNIPVLLDGFDGA